MAPACRNFIAIQQGFEGTWLNPISALVRAYGTDGASVLSPEEAAGIPAADRYVAGVYWTVVTVATLGYGGLAVGASAHTAACGAGRAGGRGSAAGAAAVQPWPCASGHATPAQHAATTPASCAGDIVPQNSLEMLVDCGVIAVGVLMFGLALGSLGDVVASSSKEARQAQARGLQAGPGAASQRSVVFTCRGAWCLLAASLRQALP